MAALGRFKLKHPLDNWTLREKLALACAVLRSGDQNWVSVSRQVKPFGEADRSSEWFSQRNCAAQYTDLLETVETPNRRKRGERESTESPQLLIARKLTLERVEELREVIKKEQDEYYTMLEELERIRTGHCDDRIVEMWAEIQEKERLKQEEAALRAEKGAGDLPSAPSTPGNLTPFPEVKVKVEPEDESENVSISVTEDDISMETEEIETETVLDDNVIIKEEVISTPISFQSETIETEEVVHEPEPHIQPQEVKEEPVTNPEIIQQIVEIKQEVTEETVEIEAVEDAEVYLEPEPDLEDVIHEETCTTPFEAEEDNMEEEQEVMSEEVMEEVKPDIQLKANTSHESLQLDDNQPLSPASSVASHDTDVTFSSGHRGRRSRGGGRGRRSRGFSKEQICESKPRVSDLDTSDDDEKESNASTKPSMSFVGSLPSSPAGSNQGDLDVDEKAHKNWKKSIMLVWRATANHKYAKVFQQPVTDTVAPGYKSIVLRYACVFLHPVTEHMARGYHEIVYRPMDLQTIKKNIESGCLRTTSEFQRDIMLMFTNAIMYNSCDHNVYHMAQEMYDDVMYQIEQYVSTQAMLHTGETPTTTGSASKILRQSRRSETQTQSGSERSDVDKDDDPKKRRTSTECTQDGGKVKKRKP